MAQMGRREGAEKLVNQIACIKYTLFCFNVVSWLFGFGLFLLTVYMRAEPGFEEWVRMLNIWIYYLGVYFLIFAGVIIMISAFLGCCVALTEHKLGLTVFIASQVLCFLVSVVGSAILLDHSTFNSSIEPVVHRQMMHLIMNSEYEPYSTTLKLVQENIGCCGADGPNDYMHLRQPLPLECRDSVTGNAFFNGCVDELIWYLEDKSVWVAVLGMTLALLHVINAVLGIVFVQATKREEEFLYRR
ncbi:tetraspanin-2A [Culicoides brevitarsis]|uniref:tetraspanin-2A n=1 Tax=Culicoides brevitarsis TaxID=469753 RepID=UPI00307B4585